MNRKKFLKDMAQAGTAATLFGAAAFGRAQGPGHESAVPRKSSPASARFEGRRAASDLAAHVGFPPEAVFPLLCPVREYDWLEGWQCEMIYSKSGVAEDNCIFRTSHLGHTMTWSVSRYEPPRHIEFVAVVSDGFVMRLNIVLEPVADGTNLRWTRIFTGLSEAGNQWLAERKPELDADLTRKIEHYLKTGTMLRKETHV